MISRHIMVIDTPKPLKAHVLWLSSKAPFATGHKAFVTEVNSGKSMTTRAMKLDNDYTVDIYTRNNEFVDTFSVAYTHSADNGNVLIKL